MRAQPFSFPLPFEGVPASLGPGLRTASGTKRSLGARSPGGTPAMTAESTHSQIVFLEQTRPHAAKSVDNARYFPIFFPSSGIRGCGEKRRRAGQPLAWGRTTVGAKNGKKPVESSHWLSFAAMPGEDRESTQAQLALSPNSAPRPVLRPLGFALPEPLLRPADPNSPGRIANLRRNW